MIGRAVRLMGAGLCLLSVARAEPSRTRFYRNGQPDLHQV
jgi:hypothetical protein